MTDAELQQLKFEVENLKARFEQQQGADPNALHPHGNRQPEPQQDTSRYAADIAALQKALAVEVAWHQSLRGDNGVTVNGNVISGSGSAGAQGAADATLERHTFIFNNNGVPEYWSVVATYLGVVPP